MEHATATIHDLRGEFAELLAQHRRMLFKVVNTYARAPADRDDLYQEIALQLWRAFPGYDSARPFSTWLYRIALNVAISHLRRRTSQPITLSLEPAHEPQVALAAELDDRDEYRVLDAFVSTLDPLNRALLLLYLEERSYREMAEILGISETNVATKINRLKERVRRFGGDYGTR